MQPPHPENKNEKFTGGAPKADAPPLPIPKESCRVVVFQTVDIFPDPSESIFYFCVANADLQGS